MPASACDDRDPSTCGLLALLPTPEVCVMAVRMLALHQAATELAIATLAAVLATACSSDAAGADPPMEKPSTWREDQEKALKYALRRRKRKEKRLRAARAPVVDPAPKRAKKNCATSTKPRRQKTPRPAPTSQPAAPALSELAARKGLSRKEKKIRRKLRRERDLAAAAARFAARPRAPPSEDALAFAPRTKQSRVLNAWQDSCARNVPLPPTSFWRRTWQELPFEPTAFLRRCCLRRMAEGQREDVPYLLQHQTKSALYVGDIQRLSFAEEPALFVKLVCSPRIATGDAADVPYLRAHYKKSAPSCAAIRRAFEPASFMKLICWSRTVTGDGTDVAFLLQHFRKGTFYLDAIRRAVFSQDPPTPPSTGP